MITNFYSLHKIFLQAAKSTYISSKVLSRSLPKLSIHELSWPCQPAVSPLPKLIFGSDTPLLPLITSVIRDPWSARYILASE